LHVDGVRMFGPGTHELLRHVEDTGSLHQAAKLMGMSYTKAWRLLRKTEEHLGWPLVERRVGGATGGGTSLTARGRDLLERFEQFRAETDAAMHEAFHNAFGGWPSSTEAGS
jgi:molybdate transport system regulatory protein